ncbi:hypothetical protein [Tahibacter amnicola]|uniref:Uncharacterized protein n=1 Tax=Tahibacter amnicola TaxID=2976241 RepID=A0ABY6BAN6_9GAMM|nr:hypothetical protein [Tahibacter amnicola]UXI66929.1 hypothetical protein N4264_19545 [Tahibacter amnicola]
MTCTAGVPSTAWLILLERSYAGVCDQLRISAGEDAGRELITSLPFETAIVSGLQSESPYWIDLGLRRIEEGMFSSQFVDPLTLLMNSPQLPQRIRHRSLRILADHRLLH